MPAGGGAGARGAVPYDVHAHVYVILIDRDATRHATAAAQRRDGLARRLAATAVRYVPPWHPAVAVTAAVRRAGDGGDEEGRQEAGAAADPPERQAAAERPL